jgi:DnaJ-class molecular chaperone
MGAGYFTETCKNGKVKQRKCKRCHGYGYIYTDKGEIVVPSPPKTYCPFCGPARKAVNVLDCFEGGGVYVGHKVDKNGNWVYRNGEPLYQQHLCDYCHGTGVDPEYDEKLAAYKKALETYKSTINQLVSN